MKVKCIKTAYADDTEVVLRYGANFVATHILLDKGYIVYAITNFKGMIEYLIYDETLWPRLYPANFFDVVDTQLPYEEWHFGKFQYSSAVDDSAQIYYVLGSKEMATDEDLWMSIIEMDCVGLLHLKEWRKLVDRQYEGY